MAVVARIVVDFIWTDKRTAVYRRARNFLIYTVLASAVGNLAILWLDEDQRRKANEVAEANRVEFENKSLGGISPEIWLLYYKSNKLVCPRPDKSFPGDDLGMWITTQVGIGSEPTLALLIRNPYSFPIYDTEIAVWQETPNINNSKSLLGKWPEPLKIPLMHPAESTIKIFDASEEFSSKLVTLGVKTRRGMSTHEVAIALVSNNWEYASGGRDWASQNQFSVYKSEYFPLNTNGRIEIQVVTRDFTTNSNSIPNSSHPDPP